MRLPSLYISEIISAIDSIDNFTSGMNKDGFLDDEKTKSAVVRQFEIMGEASKALPKSIKELAPDIPWSNIAGMRDRLIHAYFVVDYNLVWKTLEEELPGLKERLERLERLEMLQIDAIKDEKL